MTTPQGAGERADPLEDPIPRARPRATAYVLGALLIAIIGSATAILSLIPSKNIVIRPANHHGAPFVVTHASVWLAASGLAFGLIGLMSLVYGNTRRVRLIYDFTASAAELTAVLMRIRPEQRDRGDLDNDADQPAEDYRRNQYIKRLNDYKEALLKLGAYEHALQVSRWIAQSGGRLPYGLRDRV